LTPQQLSIEENLHQMTGFTSQIFDTSNRIGLEKDAKEIKGWIIYADKALHSVGFVRMGGLGKSTMAQKMIYTIDLNN